MIRRFIVINGVMYAVPTPEEFSALKERVVSAALAGAGLVELPVPGDRAITVMITTHIPVLFEERQVDDDEAAESGVESLGDILDGFEDFDD